jgi:hypothetical protein
VSGNPYVLTAGHCQTAGPNWSTDLYNYSQKKIGGLFSPSHNLYTQQPAVDAVLIKVDSVNNWGVAGGILKRSGTPSMGLDGVAPPVYDEMYEINGYQTSVVNERVCISPALTGGFGSQPQGGSCGRVLVVGMQLTTTPDYVETVVNKASYCSRGGDSGSPVFDGNNQAKGIHRAAGQSTVVCGSEKYFSPMKTILDRYNAIQNAVTFY